MDTKTFDANLVTFISNGHGHAQTLNEYWLDNHTGNRRIQEKDKVSTTEEYAERFNGEKLSGFVINVEKARTIKLVKFDITCKDCHITAPEPF